MELNKRFKLRRREKGKDGLKPLLNDTTVQHTETTDEIDLVLTQEQAFKIMEKTNQPDLISTEVEINGDAVLKCLTKILSIHSYPQDINNAAVMVNKWGRQNDVTTDKKGGTYPQVWLCEFLQEISQSVKSHLPILPVEETQRSDQLVEFLRSAENITCTEVCRLTPVLKDAGLLGYLIESYNHQLFTKLNLLLNKDLSVNEVLCLLWWGKRVFFSPDSQDVFRMCDPLLFSQWFERTKEKLLPLLKKEISIILQNILRYEKTNEDNERSMSEEWFIQVHIDVTQCLQGAIQNAKAFSLTLLHMVQKLCLEELHGFVKNYVHGERKHLENLQPPRTNYIYLCRTVSTCMQLRSLAVQISDSDKNKSDDIVCMLKKLEDHVLSIAQKIMKRLALVRLESYFEKEDEHIYILTKEIRMQCASLPQNKPSDEIKTIIVNLAYNCVSHVYLDCLMKNKFHRLERRWGNVEERIRDDVQMFHNTFTQLNGNDDQNQLLSRMSEVLFNHNTETLKSTCSNLFKDFPEDSELYLPGLLRWKKVLSNQQVREVLDVGRLGRPNLACDNLHSRMNLCCCFCC